MTDFVRDVKALVASVKQVVTVAVVSHVTMDCAKVVRVRMGSVRPPLIAVLIILIVIMGHVGNVTTKEMIATKTMIVVRAKILLFAVMVANVPQFVPTVCYLNSLRSENSSPTIFLKTSRLSCEHPRIQMLNQ